MSDEDETIIYLEFEEDHIPKKPSWVKRNEGFLATLAIAFFAGDLILVYYAVTLGFFNF